VSSAAWPRRLQSNTMELNKFVFGALAAGCWERPAAGGFVAARHGSSVGSRRPGAVAVADASLHHRESRWPSRRASITPEAPLPAGPRRFAVAPVRDSRTEGGAPRRRA
jgi:hypothetical protein